MNAQTQLKIIKKALELAELLIEAKKQFKGVPPIPDYTKGGVFNSSNQTIIEGKIEKVLNPEAIYEALKQKQESVILPDGGIFYPNDKKTILGNPKATEIYSEEAWSKKINEILKQSNLNPTIENKDPKIDYNAMFGETGKSQYIGDFSEKIKASFEYWNNVWDERLKYIPSHNKNSLFGNYKPEYEKYSKAKCNHNRLRLKVLSMIANEDYPTKCEDCGQFFSYQYWIDRNLSKECKHQKVTTTQYFKPISGKVIFTSKVCNDCNADLLK